jgi:hypothetical protein
LFWKEKQGYRGNFKGYERQKRVGVLDKEQRNILNCKGSKTEGGRSWKSGPDHQDGGFSNEI